MSSVLLSGIAFDDLKISGEEACNKMADLPFYIGDSAIYA
jgi:hypothetical protein